MILTVSIAAKHIKVGDHILMPGYKLPFEVIEVGDWIKGRHTRRPAITVAVQAAKIQRVVRSIEDLCEG